MNADDPRHGSSAGYNAGCHDECCRTALADYARHARTRRYLYGELKVNGLGTRRRIRALMALGWSTTLLDHRLGQARTYTAAILCGADTAPVYRATARRFAELYDQLSMSHPPAETGPQRQLASRMRNYAQKKGWPPPLAWDDIDTDPHPTGRRWNKTTYDGKDMVDEVVVLRILAGERLPANHAERVEATRRWLLAGGSARSLCQLQGWKEGRYSRVTAEGAA